MRSPRWNPGAAEQRSRKEREAVMCYGQLAFISYVIMHQALVTSFPSC
jgi:hypothetical protein